MSVCTTMNKLFRSLRRGLGIGLLASLMSGLAANATPVLDRTFGAYGAVHLGVPAGQDDLPSAATQQRDGKLLVAGQTNGTQFSSFVVRLNVDGTRDASFGQQGVAYFSTGVQQIEQQADGSILVGNMPFTGSYFVTRLTSAGAVDTTFASGGTFRLELGPVGTPVIPVAFIGQADGNVLLVIDATTGRDFAVRLTRLTAAGVRDETFGPNGERLITGLPLDFKLMSGNFLIAEPDRSFTAVAVASNPGFPGTYLLLRMRPTGTLDPAFGADGIVSGYDVGYPFDIPASIVRAADGALVLLGDSVAESDERQKLWRVLRNGTAAAASCFRRERMQASYATAAGSAPTSRLPRSTRPGFCEPDTAAEVGSPWPIFMPTPNTRATPSIQCWSNNRDGSFSSALQTIACCSNGGCRDSPPTAPSTPRSAPMARSIRDRTIATASSEPANSPAAPSC